MEDTGDTTTTTAWYVGLISQDGRWRWDGAQWVPAQQQWVPPAPVQNKSTFWPVLGALIAFAVIALIVYGMYYVQHEEQQGRDEMDRMFCDEYGICD